MQEIDLSAIKTYPIKQRTHKCTLDDLYDLTTPAPQPLANEQLHQLVECIVKAYRNHKRQIWMIGAHVIKVGLSPILIDLMAQGVIQHLAMNGAGPIHDFELALHGATSEIVSDTINDGAFGMVTETLEMLNQAIVQGHRNQWGYGEAIARYICSHHLPYEHISLLAAAWRHNVYITVHSAIGTETIYQSPHCDGAAVGATSYRDFKRFCHSLSQSEDGVVLNIGSAVVLPEVFLKALAVVRNLGYHTGNLTTANLDMLAHYRPRINVVERPVQHSGQGFNIIARHEQTLPTIYTLLRQQGVLKKHANST